MREESKYHVDNWRMNIPGRGNNKLEDPHVRHVPRDMNYKEARAAGIESVRE